MADGKSPATRRRGVAGNIRGFLTVVLALTVVRSAVADWNDVPSGSMRPTILEGDRIFVNKLAYDLKVPYTTWHIAKWSDPRRNDVVIFYSPQDGTRLVKRVIGEPGDLVEMRGEKPVGRAVGVAISVDPNRHCLPRWGRWGQGFAR